MNADLMSRLISSLGFKVPPYRVILTFGDKFVEVGFHSHSDVNELLINELDSLKQWIRQNSDVPVYKFGYTVVAGIHILNRGTIWM
jgi:hypothetical protein